MDVNLDFSDAHSRFGLEGSSVDQDSHLTKWGRLFVFPFPRVNCYQNEGFFLTLSDSEPFSRICSGSHSSRKGSQRTRVDHR